MNAETENKSCPSADAAIARIALDTFPRLMEEYVEERPLLKAIARGASPVQIEFEQEEIKRQFAVINGEMRTGSAIVAKSVFVVRFENLEHLGALLRGGLRSGPPEVPHWSLTDFTGSILAGLAALTGVTLHPAAPLATAADRRLRAKLLLHAACYAMESVARMDAEIHRIIEGVDGDVVQIGVAPSGPFVHFTFNPGEILASRGPHPSPHAEVVIEDMRTFNRLIGRKLDPIEAWKNGNVRIEGESALALMCGALVKRLLDLTEIRVGLP